MREKPKPLEKKDISDQLKRYGYHDDNYLKEEMQGYLKQHPQDLVQRAVDLYGERLVSFITKTLGTDKVIAEGTAPTSNEPDGVFSIQRTPRTTSVAQWIDGESKPNLEQKMRLGLAISYAQNLEDYYGATDEVIRRRFTQLNGSFGGASFAEAIQTIEGPDLARTHRTTRAPAEGTLFIKTIHSITDKYLLPEEK